MSTALSVHDHHAGLTYAFIRRVIAHACPGCLRALEEDLVQRAMLRVSTAFAKDRERSLNRTYLRQIARSVVLDEIRRQRVRRGTRADTERVEQARSLGAEDPERRASARELLAIAHRILEERVSPRRAEAVRHYLSGQTIPEVAATMGVAVKSADNLVYRGIRDLRAALEGHGQPPA